MNRRGLLLGAPAIVLATSLGLTRRAGAANAIRLDPEWEKTNRTRDIVLVHFRERHIPAAALPILQRNRARPVRYVERADHLRAFRTLGDATELARELSESGLVRSALPDITGSIITATLTPNDPYYNGTTETQPYLDLINCPEVWALYRMADYQPSIPVIVDIDTGCGPHTELTAGIINTGINGQNVLSDNTTLTDLYGHGTLVSSLLAASTNNGAGVASVGWGGTVLPVVAIDSSGVPTTLNIIAAYDWILANLTLPCLINTSFVGPTYTPGSTIDGLVKQLWTAGCFMAAGGGDIWANSTPSTPTCSAGPCDSPYILGVAGVDGSKAAWNDSGAGHGGSGYGPSASGTGAGALVSVNSGTFATGIWLAQAVNSYSNPAGTSFASPQVLAVARTLMVANPKLKNTDLWDLITNPANGQTVTGFVNTVAPWVNPVCLDFYALLEAALSYKGPTWGSGSLMRRR